MSKHLSANPRADIYQRVTDIIIRDLEQGTRSWTKPWTTTSKDSDSIRPLRHDGTPYRGINVLILWSEAIEHGYTSSTWMTYRQAQALGAQVRKGEHGATVVYAKTIERIDGDLTTGDEAVTRIPMLRAYTVFNTDQIDGLPVATPAQPSAITESVSTRIERADAFIAATRATIVHRGNRACYIPSADRIEMPPYGQFIDTPTASAAEGYYATVLHELVHWTSPSHRCDRDLGKRFGDHAYAREELVAEIGAAFLCADLSITLEPRPDHAAYLGNWLAVLKSDKRAIFTAAALAQKAVDWLTGIR
ncbi:ArdC family protein [Afipia birgiae]|jgi:antirestriction protein ArdC|uniref:ArdC family protein n=1 Tax=Afipia birgiae TaxID=151414 RepID=UPI000318B820|nr:zincin-like metallopeptidase domain-containing protein [Afipia birgiae]